MSEDGNTQGARQIMGVDEGVTWSEIYEVLGEQERRICADKLGVSRDTPAEEIDVMLLERKRV